MSRRSKGVGNFPLPYARAVITRRQSLLLVRERENANSKPATPIKPRTMDSGGADKSSHREEVSSENGAALRNEIKVSLLAPSHAPPGGRARLEA